MWEEVSVVVEEGGGRLLAVRRSWNRILDGEGGVI